jgi:2-C-methyl-D-erythritol 2,4-cyclodiphosphate synthase
MNLVGIGYDVHRFAEGRKLVLGGVDIPHPEGLDGHSDADVLCHAIADAILGARLINIDASLIAEAPKIAPHLSQMKANLAQVLGIDPRRVGIKATTNERMGFLGRKEGIAAMAVASVDASGDFRVD